MPDDGPPVGFGCLHVALVLLALLARLVEERMQILLFLKSDVADTDLLDLAKAKEKARVLVTRRATLDTQIAELTREAEERGSLEVVLEEQHLLLDDVALPQLTAR